MTDLRTGKGSPSEIRQTPAITDQEFALFQALIQRRAGVHLSDTKRMLLVARLVGRLRTLGLASFDAYYRRITKEGDEQEAIRMIDCILTNETRFFREPKQFDLLERTILPRWAAEAAAGRRPRHVRAWSAACSTGEEPHSIAMSLLHYLPPSSGFSVEVLATDLSTSALRSAESGIFRIERASEIPLHYLQAFMLEGTGKNEGIMKADANLRSVIRFSRLNLNADMYPPFGRFDLIFCRNVLIYFNAATKLRVIHHLLDYLAPGGYFFVGHAESSHGSGDRLRSVIPNVYLDTRGERLASLPNG